MTEDYPRTLLELEPRFADNEACRAYLFALRWPGGFVCPRCQGRTAWPTRRGLWLCGNCRHQASVTAGTIFQDSHLPLTTWFRTLWHVTSQKTGVNALGLQHVLGLGSYKTAWAMLHKLRRAMVRPGRDRLTGVVEVDETYWGGAEAGVIGRLTHGKALIVVAAQEDGRRIGRIRLRRVPDLTKGSLHGFIHEAIEPGSTVRTDGLNAYLGLKGYIHDRQIQRKQPAGEHLLPRVHRVVSLLKHGCWVPTRALLGMSISTLTSTSLRSGSTAGHRPHGASSSTVLPSRPCRWPRPRSRLSDSTSCRGRLSQVNSPSRF